MARRRIQTAVGVILMLAGFALFGYGLVKALHTGTCASGGPYQTARPCPSGTGWVFGGIFGGVIIMLIGAAVFFTRGRRPGDKDSSLTDGIAWGTALFGLFFLGTGLVALYGAFGPGSNDAPGAKLGAGIVGLVFIPMGLIPLILALWAARGRRSKPAASRPPSTPATGVSAGLSQEGLRKLAQMQRPYPTAQPPPAAAKPKLTSSGNATVKSFKYLGKSTTDATLVQFDLEVVAGGDPIPYEVVHEQMVPLDRVKRLATGTVVPVRVERDNPAALTLDL